MTDAREEILSRARAALAGRSAPAPEVPRAYLRAGASALDSEARMVLFGRRVTEYGATVHRSTSDTLATVVERLLHDAGARRVCAPGGLGLEVPGAQLVRDEPALTVEQLDGFDGVLTGCALAIAETGTIVLDGGGRSGRRAISLVPDLHICLVAADQLVATVPDAISRLAERGLQGTPLTFVSGPSATSDIGFERVEGVHGPRRLEVILEV